MPPPKKNSTAKSTSPEWLYHMTNAAAAISIQQSQMNPDHQGRVWGAPTLGTAASRHATPDDTAILRFRASVSGDTLKSSTKMAWHVTPSTPISPSQLQIFHRTAKKWMPLVGADIAAATAAPPRVRSVAPPPNVATLAPRAKPIVPPGTSASHQPTILPPLVGSGKRLWRY